MNMISKIHFIVLFFFLCIASDQVDATIIEKKYFSGLTFKSHEVPKDERTSLNLIPGKPIHLKGGFTFEFDLKLHETSFGHVFRLILNDSTSLDMFVFSNNGNISFVLNNAPKPCLVSDLDIKKCSLYKGWAKVSVKVGDKSIVCTINNQTTKFNRSLNDFDIDKLFFGANKYKSFFTSDVPQMTVRKIILKDNKGNSIRNWSLAKHGNRVAYDLIGNNPAFVENGIWEIDKHIRWQKELELTLNQPFPQIATDTLLNRVFVATADSLYIFNITKKTIKKIRVAGGEPFLESSSYLIFNQLTNQLISYNNNQPDFITFDFATNKWSDSPKNKDLSIQHHNRFIDKQANKLVLFGGYGKFKYNSILATHNLNGGTWSLYDFSKKIPPRYLASLGSIGNGKFLIFGGFGCESGFQEQSPHNYYDLFQLDINQKTCHKLGELKAPQDHYNFGNSLVIHSNKFYSLAYRNDLQKSNIRLIEVDTKTLDYQIYDDSISYCFLDRDSYCDLYLSNNKTFYAIVLQRNVRTIPFTIRIYSLAFAPLKRADVLQQNATINVERIYLIIGFCLIFLLLMVYIYIHKKKKSEASGLMPLLINEIYLPKKASACILFLGDFIILDKKGLDISTSFTLITKQLLAACLLEYYTFGNGLTSRRLEEMFWFDMDKANATNNRNVNIRKLRILLDQIGDITMTKDTNFWEIKIGEYCFCDYMEVITLLNDAKKQKLVDKNVVTKIVEISKSGTLLPDFDFEWIDKYKSHYSYLLIEVLMKASVQPGITNNLKLLVDLSQVILIHDKIDEEAIQIKCRSLYKLGQKGLSKQCFDRFCADYIQILNEEPKLKYETIILAEKE